MKEHDEKSEEAGASKTSKELSNLSAQVERNRLSAKAFEFQPRLDRPITPEELAARKLPPRSPKEAVELGRINEMMKELTAEKKRLFDDPINQLLANDPEKVDERLLSFFRAIVDDLPRGLTYIAIAFNWSLKTLQDEFEQRLTVIRDKVAQFSFGTEVGTKAKRVIWSLFGKDNLSLPGINPDIERRIREGKQTIRPDEIQELLPTLQKLEEILVTKRTKDLWWKVWIPDDEERYEFIQNFLLPYLRLKVVAEAVVEKREKNWIIDKYVGGRQYNLGLLDSAFFSTYENVKQREKSKNEISGKSTFERIAEVIGEDAANQIWIEIKQKFAMP